MNIITRLHALQEDWLRMDADPDVDTSAYGTCAEDIGGLIAEYEDQPLASEPARTPTEDQLRRDIGADQLPPATVSPAPLSRAAFTARVEQALTWQVLERADVAKFDAFGANAARAAHISVLADALYPVLGAAMMTQLKQENTDEQKRTNEGEVSDLRREDAGARPVLGEAMPRLLKETVEGEVEEVRRQRLGAASPVAGAPETGWQPIETAPRDRTHVIVYYDRDKYPKPYVAYFAPDIAGGCWLSWVGAIKVNPTHWHPLPALPAPPAGSPEL
jgi:hypothetical protein